MQEEGGIGGRSARGSARGGGAGGGLDMSVRG